MYRVVTVMFERSCMGRKRRALKGPLHPDERHAQRWAEFLRQVGHYHDVKVEGNRQNQASHFDMRR